MLSRRENKVMKFIFDKCSNKKNTCLISYKDILKALYPMDLNETEIDEILNNLTLEDYISLIVSEKNNKPVFCISLKEKGEAFLREKANKKKTWIVLITRTVALACLSFVVGIVLKLIFS